MSIRLAHLDCWVPDIVVRADMPDSAIFYRQQAERCVRLARSCLDPRAAESLRLMAEEFMMKAATLEKGENDNRIELKPSQS